MFRRESRKRVADRLGSYLRLLRQQKGWTQSLAGEAVGVDAVTIRRWELGLFSPSSNRIEQVAEAYGVEVSALIEAAEPAEPDESATRLSIRGYLGAGTAPQSGTNDLGNISLPSHMVEGHPDDFWLRVSGDSLVPDGIHDGDVLLVCPRRVPSIGNLCILDLENHHYAAIYVTQESLRVRTNTGTTVDMEILPEQLVGIVAWHVRKL